MPDPLAAIRERRRLAHADPVAFAQHATSDIDFLLSIVETHPDHLIKVGFSPDKFELRADGYYLKTRSN